MKKIRLTKLTDDCFEGNHPNGIYEGHVEIGYMINKPKIEERFYIFRNKLNIQFSTSDVTKELNNDNVFKTTYSTYKIEYLD